MNHKNSNNSKIFTIYSKLLENYGPQGWWPILNDEGEGIYYRGDYSHPQDTKECFEVCLGSILTQNTTFGSVLKSLQNLQALNALDAKKIKTLHRDQLKQAIRPSGYFNQKSEYILIFTAFYEALKGAIPSREALLDLKGIGQETADSILLYGYHQPELKVDAYTKRLLIHHGFIDEKVAYQEMKELLQQSLRSFIKDEKHLIIAYKEFHALIVHHGKQCYSKKPYGVGCFL